MIGESGKIFLPFAFQVAACLVFGFSPPVTAEDLSLTLKGGLWKSSAREPSYQDITIDLACDRDRCQPEAWAYAPQFNQADHQGTATLRQLGREWRSRVNLTISPDPWLSTTGKATYEIAFQVEGNRITGNYSGTFKNQPVRGKVEGIVSPSWIAPIPAHRPLRPQEHPRLVFRQQQLPSLREKAKTPYGRAILAQLKRTLAQPIDYRGYVPNGGYHAAGYCLLAALNRDSQATETGWHLVENSLKQPGSRLFEQSPIVAGVALAYDLCYWTWSRERRLTITRWLAQEAQILIAGTPNRGWNPNAWSNWSARARGAAGLAALAILDEPEMNTTEVRRWLAIAQRNLKRYLTIGIGDRGFGSEGDHYTTEPWILTIIPLLQAYQTVLGQDLVQGSSAAWFLPHYLTRSIEREGKLAVPTYGRHRHYAGSSLFAMGLGLVPQRFLPAVLWLFERRWGMAGDRSFGIQSPQDAIYAFTGYRDGIAPQNPAAILGRVLVDERQGFYVFRDRWQDDNDFVASIYAKRQQLRGSWSFPDSGSFRIWGLGGRWANPGASDGKRASENVVLRERSPNNIYLNKGGDPSIPASPRLRVPVSAISNHLKANEDNPTAQPIFFQASPDGSGVVSLQGDGWLRSFAVDYSGAAGVPALFAIADKFTDQTQKTWVMHAEGSAIITGQTFTLTAANGATLQGTFITPQNVKVAFQPEKTGGKILATGNGDFFVIMTVQKRMPPSLQITGTGLEAQVRVGHQVITFGRDRLAILMKTAVDFQALGFGIKSTIQESGHSDLLVQGDTLQLRFSQ